MAQQCYYNALSMLQCYNVTSNVIIMLLQERLPTALLANSEPTDQQYRRQCYNSYHHMIRVCHRSSLHFTILANFTGLNSSTRLSTSNFHKGHLFHWIHNNSYNLHNVPTSPDILIHKSSSSDILRRNVMICFNFAKLSS